MCSQQDEGQESLEEELDVLFLDDEGEPTQGLRGPHPHVAAPT